MDPSKVAAFVVACLIFYRIINVAVKLLKITLLSDYPLRAEDLPSLPIVGHAYLFVGSTETILNRVIGIGHMYPTSFRFSIGYNSLFCATSPEHLKLILHSSKTVERNNFYEYARPWMGDGLITAPGSIWEVHRKLLQPFFNTMVLKSFVEIFTTQSVILAKKIEQHLDGPEFEISRYVSLCTLDAICETATGIKLEAQESNSCQYEEASHKVMVGYVKRAASPWLYSDFIFYRTQLGKDEKKHIKFMHELTDNVIRKKKAEIVQHSDSRVSVDNEQGSADISMAAPQLLIDNLLRLSGDNEVLTDKMVRDHIDSIMVAGSDTTATTVNYLMLMLASHQDIQDKVYQELCENFGENVSDDDGEELPITMEVLARMTYMDRVIKETIRLFPVVCLVFRKATEDLDLGQFTLPRGSSIALNFIGVHRSEKYWPDPLKFDPDRFLPERFAQQEPYSYLPFGGGRRNCIGSKYAVMFMKIIVATILRKYVLTKDEVVPVEDLRLKMDFVLKPVDPITLRIQRRPKRKSESTLRT
ncbi:cytochrome P450 4C1-like [Diprion similis]|uniref:cytochrome P450 4C1-like n=1 Tax=Diprion similis TaxID=362088 RepID=UPI001EF860B5|nr:cytochrome P450 4C1-like [Diprion similis]